MELLGLYCTGRDYGENNSNFDTKYFLDLKTLSRRAPIYREYRSNVMKTDQTKKGETCA